MDSPELLLKGLNNALRELRGAVTLLTAAPTDGAADIAEGALQQSLSSIMRRLLLAEVLGERPLIAVGGSQGAGKTTLLRTLYDLDGQGWLEPNEGRGETVPVLVQEEAGLEMAQGFVRSLVPAAGGYRIEDLTLTVDEFQQAVTHPQPGQLLPVLKVPQRYLRLAGQGWLLLPGYERLNRQNKEWQALMRQALVAASGCVIVTDTRRLANQEQIEIANDMRANELQGAQVILVVSKTEELQHDPQGRQAVVDAARSVFGLDESQPGGGQVFCVGAGESSFVDVWRPAFVEALQGIAHGAGGNRQAQRNLLKQTITRDLAVVLARVEMEARQHFGTDHGGSGAQTLAECLEAFDEQNASQREQFRKSIRGMLERHSGASWEQLQQALENDHEGVRNNLQDFFRKATSSARRVEESVKQAWSHPGPLLDHYAVAVGQITAGRLGAPELTKLASKTLPALPSGTLAQRLGYEHEGDAQAWTRPNERDEHNLKALFAPVSSLEQGVARTNAELSTSIELLPALVLEYTRYASQVAPLLDIDTGQLQARPDLLQNGAQGVENGVKLGRTVLRGIAAVLAVDVAVDGQLDLAGPLSGTGAAAGGAAGALGSAVVGVVAVGYLVHSALKETRQHDEKARLVFQRMLANIAERHETHLLENYDAMQAQMRSMLKNALRRRFGLDQQLMEKDRLTKAISDVRLLSRDLSDSFGRSAYDLDLFAVNPAAQ